VNRAKNTYASPKKENFPETLATQKTKKISNIDLTNKPDMKPYAREGYAVPINKLYISNN
jgi:hypothetical protein